MDIAPRADDQPNSKSEASASISLEQVWKEITELKRLIRQLQYADDDRNKRLKAVENTKLHLGEDVKGVYEFATMMANRFTVALNDSEEAWRKDFNELFDRIEKLKESIRLTDARINEISGLTD